MIKARMYHRRMYMGEGEAKIKSTVRKLDKKKSYAAQYFVLG